MSSVRTRRKAAKRAALTPIPELPIVDEPVVTSVDDVASVSALNGLEVALGAAIENPPERSRIAFSREGGCGEIVLPRTGLNPGSTALCLFGLSFCSLGTLAVLAVVGVWQLPFHGSHVAGWALGVGFLFVGLVLVLVGAVLGMIREVVRERGDGLCVSRECAGLGWRHRFLLKRSIEEVVLEPIVGEMRSRERPEGNERSSAIVLFTEDVAVRIGRSVGEDERRWLVRALRLLICR